jgi:hypothetical protein
VRAEWQGEEFAILETRDEVVRARQRETLLDILAFENLARAERGEPDAPLEEMLAEDPRVRDFMRAEIEPYVHKAIEVAQTEAKKGGTQEDVKARFLEHFDGDAIDFSQPLGEIIVREAAAYDEPH